ncbi:MAG: hypothetical protein K6T86_20280 [Pirellulales bacterium]|nr:hypothetical protein [Pirellulales bacterium]
MRDKLTFGRLACRKNGGNAQNEKSGKGGLVALAVLRFQAQTKKPG